MCEVTNSSTNDVMKQRTSVCTRLKKSISFGFTYTILKPFSVADNLFNIKQKFRSYYASCMNMESETSDGWLIFVGQTCNKLLQLIGFVDIYPKGVDNLNDIVAKSYLYFENFDKKLNVRECAKSLDQ